MGWYLGERARDGRGHGPTAGCSRSANSANCAGVKIRAPSTIGGHIDPALLQPLGEQATEPGHPTDLQIVTRRTSFRYEPVLATIEYRWHPLFGRRLRLREGARRGRVDIVLVEDQPGRLRELPRWMCDPAVCAGMDQGPAAGRAPCAVEAGGRSRRDVRSAGERAILGRSSIPGGRPVPRKHPPSPSQLRLSFEAGRDRPPRRRRRRRCSRRSPSCCWRRWAR